MAGTKRRSRHSRLATAAAGLEGATPTPANSKAGGQRHRASAMSVATQRAALPSSLGAAQSRTLASGGPGAAVCARACAPVVAAPSDRIECATRKQRRCDPWGLRRRPSVRAQLIPAFRFTRPCYRVRDRHPNGPRRTSDSAARMRRKARPRDSAEREPTPPSKAVYAQASL